MKKFYYIKIRWQGKCVYDGYFMKKENNKIVGFTDYTIICGDESCIMELSCEEVLKYPIQSELYEGGKYFVKSLQDNEENVIVSIKSAPNMDETRINDRINSLLKIYPDHFKTFFSENFA